MKVLCILSNLYLPGSGCNKEHTYSRVMQMFSEMGMDLSVLALNAPVLSGQKLKNMEAGIRSIGCKLVLPSFRLSAGFGKAARFSRENGMTRFFLGKGLRINGAMQLILQGGRPDIICDLQGGSRSGFTALLLSQLYDIPFVVWERKTGFQRDHITGIALERRRRILQQASEVAAVSPQLADSIRQSMDLPDLTVNTIPNLIPEAVPQPCGRSGKYSGLTGGSFVFAAWTNWRSFKRMDLLLTSFAQVVEKGYDARLLIAGSGEAARRLACGRERVEWLGQLDRNGIISLADTCDCCVIPSDVETFGLPAIEAMACGRPVVATICGGPESIITHPGLGRTVPAGNADALADAMIDVIENRHTFVSADIRRHFDETYSPEALRKDWQSVLSRGAGPKVH